MPGPPPPPPAAPPPPMMAAPPVFAPPKGGADDRSALLSSIRQGKKLKKTVTVDKSAPLIPGKVTNSNNAISSSGSSSNFSAAPMTNGLGGLFAGGMPKLRPTGRQLDGATNNSNAINSHINNNNTNKSYSSNKQKSPDIPPALPQNNFSNIQNELKKQLASDSRNRGPPPPAPIRNNVEDLPSPRQPFVTKNGNSNGLHQQSISSTLNLSSLQANTSTLHRKASSNTNISTIDGSISTVAPAKPVISHRKPNLAPKPPMNGKPAAPPKKLIMNGKPISRAQSMKSPRSPSPQSPDGNNSVAKFGTVRNLTSVIGNSLAASTGNLTQRQRPPLNMRPNAPPPSVPPMQQPPPPPSKMNFVKPPNHAPPPPPNVLPQPPSHAPPPPPQRIQAPSRAPPAIPQHNSAAPPPPPRHSSIRGDSNVSSKRILSNTDLEVKYGDSFHAVTDFPRPQPYRRVFKAYTGKQVGSKQQAPKPPNQIHQQNRGWDMATC